MSTLRADKLQTLAGTSKDIAKLVDDSTIVDSASFSSDAEFNAAKVGKISLDAQKRTRSTSFIAGTEEVSGATTRDAFVVGRNVTGATDCHGFADRTVMSGVTDAGTYGSFDCTARLDGANTQNHVFTFQDRVIYNGSGVLQNSAGFLSRAQHTGTGTIAKRIGVDVAGVEVTGGGAVTEQTGVLVRDITAGAAKVGVNIEQATGFALYANGGARSFHKGGFRIGVDDESSVPLSVGAPGSSNFYVLPSAGNVQLGASGASVLQLLTESAVRAEISTSGNGYGFRPGADNAQPLGATNRRWSQLFAGTATISTSDAREKTAVRQFNVAEVAAAKDLAKEIGAFRFLAAVAEKGDSAREHIGMTVQRAIEVMESHGLDPFGYSFICYDEWDAQSEIRDEKGDAVVREAEPAGNRYSFRFEGLLAFIAAGFEARLAALEAAL